ncbi:MAG: T9SS C-terminal target domain-containing protein [Calditrichaeota bacterium]|nr:MAG: T9SS C-terminal target domain-containing protein [Calditrichota bacterium]
MLRTKHPSFWTGFLLGCLVCFYLPGKSQSLSFQRVIKPFPVKNQYGVDYPFPMLGGYNSPRPQWVDLDLDGDLDLFVQVEFDKLIYFENVGSATSPQLEWRTDWFQQLSIGSWYVFRDMDGDGDPDLFAEQVFGLIRYYRNDGPPGNPQFVPAADTLKADDGSLIFAESASIPTLADIDCDGDLDLFTGNSLDGTINFYTNTGSGPGSVPRFHFITSQFQGISIISGGKGRPRASQPHGSNALEFADIDADGDLDLFWGDFFTESLYFLENSGTCTNPNIHIVSNQYPPGSPILTGGFNVPRFADIDADGDLDLFVGVQGGAVSNTQNLVDNFFFLENIGTPQSPDFFFQTGTFVSSIDIGDKSIPALADINGDGDLDLIVANEVNPPNGQTSHLILFSNQGSATQPSFRLTNTHFTGLEVGFNYAPAFGDLDGDGDLDLLVGEWSGNLNYLRNDGTAQAPQYVLVEENFAGIDVGLNSTPALVDIDADGDLDLFIGEFSGNINFYRNEGTAQSPAFVLDTTHYLGLDVGQHSFPAFADIDHDGDPDLFVGNANGEVVFYRNQGSPQQPQFQLDPSFQLHLRTFTTPAFGDLDGDGDLDLICGNVGGGLYYFQNQELTTGIQEPPAGGPTPEGITLLRNYPNPFNPETTIAFEISLPPEKAGTTYQLLIYSVTGQRIRQWRLRASGGVNRERILWDGRDQQGRLLPSGVYFVQLKIPGLAARTEKMLLVK